MIKAIVPSSLVLPGQALNTLATSAVLLGVGEISTTSGAGDMVEYDIPNPTDKLYSLLTPTSVAGIVSSYGGTVEGYVVYVRMSKNYAETTDVPSFIPNATGKWSDFAPTGSFTVDGTEYITKEGTDGVSYWDGSVIAQLVGLSTQTPDMDVLTPPEFRAWKPSEE